MRHIVEFVANHENCTLQDIQRALPDQAGHDITGAVWAALDRGLIKTRIRHIRALEGATKQMGRLSITSEGKRWLRRT